MNEPRRPEPPPAGTPVPPAYFPYWVPPEEDEIDLLDLVAVLRRRWRRIALITVLGTGLAVSYALLATPMYRAEAVIGPPQKKAQSGVSSALAAFGGFGAEIAGNLGISLGTTDANRLEAILKSHRLIARVVEKHDLLPVLFHDRWDPTAKKWLAEDPEDVPNVWDAEKLLDGLYRVKNDAKAGVLRVSFEWEDPQMAERMLRYFLDELAVVIQEDELRRIEANRRFAEQQLEKATDPVIVAKLQALLSEQIEKAMMAQNVEQFAYEAIDPPAVSDKKVKPKRALIGAVGLVASLFFGVFLAFFAEWIDNAKARAREKEAAG